jgi:hypothetical protein
VKRHQHYWQRIVGNPLKSELLVCTRCGRLRVVIVEPEGRDPRTLQGGNTVAFEYPLVRGAGQIDETILTLPMSMLSVASSNPEGSK